MNKATQEIRDAIASNNMENIRAKIQELKNVLGEISTQAYQSAGASSAQTGRQVSTLVLLRGGVGSGPTGSAAEPTGSAGRQAGTEPLAITIFGRDTLHLSKIREEEVLH